MNKGHGDLKRIKCQEEISFYVLLPNGSTYNLAANFLTPFLPRKGLGTLPLNLKELGLVYNKMDVVLWMFCVLQSEAVATPIHTHTHLDAYSEEEPCSM